MKLLKLFEILRRPRLALTLCQHRVAAGVEHINVLRSISPNSLVDVGANRGQFALALRSMNSEARIISFEPLEGPAATFRRVFRDDPNTTVVQAAVGTRAQVATMNVSARDDSSSLLPISRLQSELFPGTQSAGEMSVRVDRLRNLLSPDQLAQPSMLKIDVQGFELEVLRGSEDVLDRFDAVYVECSFLELYEGQAQAHEVVAWLRDRGFRLTGVFNNSYDRSGRSVQADFLFVR